MGQMDCHPQGQGRVIAGLVVIVVGMSLLADRVIDAEFRFTSHMWPLILMAIGTARLLDRAPARPRQRRTRAGLWLLYLGVWGLISEYRLFGFTYATSWPLLVIGAGLMIVWHAVDSRRTASHPAAQTDLDVSARPPQQQEHRS